MTRLALGVNIDHVATLRQARRGAMPDPVEAALMAIKAGADLITIHLREDRRHIQDQDVYNIRRAINVPLNLELALSEEILKIALDINPFKVTFVPEKREEITTEGGLDVINMIESLIPICDRFAKEGILVSLFVEPDPEQIRACARSHAPCIEIHTGAYANASEANQGFELEKIKRSVEHAISLGLRVYAGHGLTIKNVGPLAAIEGIEELNIGHSIIAEAVLAGLPLAIRHMKKTLKL